MMNDREDPPRRIISVIGPHSGCGKSTLICQILKHISGLGCLKISPRAEWLNPRPAKGHRPQRQHCDIVKSATLDRVEPDTSRYLAAGAVQVRWLQYDRHEVGTEIREALTTFCPGMPVITEGTAAVKHARPSAVILVTSPTPREMKPACQAVLTAVTDIMLDGPADEGASEVYAHLCGVYAELRPRFVWTADLKRNAPSTAFFDRLRGLVGTLDLAPDG